MFTFPNHLAEHFAGQSALQTLFVSTSIVALAEIGDKTQLLSFALAARYRKPWPIIWGILAATLLNHFAAAWAGQWLMQYVDHWLSPQNRKWLLAAGFLLMAGWLLIPDKFDDSGLAKSSSSIFLTTLIAFFIAEMGDKTQVATLLLAAKSTALTAVVVGTTLGMMIANVPAVFLGERLAKKIAQPNVLILVHRAAATIFLCLALAIMLA